MSNQGGLFDINETNNIYEEIVNINNYVFPAISDIGLKPTNKLSNINNISIRNNTSNINNTNNVIPNISFHFTNEKAGMEGLDREEIDKVIQEATKDSAITKKKMEDLERIKHMVEDCKVKLDNLYKNEFLLEQNRKLSETRLRELKQDRLTDRIWMHIDMDMFYAAIEIRDNPELRDKPLAVGNERMICTSNYVARKFGIRSAMPGFIAKKLCKDLIFVNPNFYKYEAESKKIMEVLHYYDPDREVRGLDEAYLDLTNYCGLNYITTEIEIRELIKEIKKRIFEATELTSSCGVACNKLLAKIGSDLQKPDGLYIIPNDIEVIENFMKALKVRKVPGVGEKLERKLNYLNIFTCQDALTRHVDLYHLFSETQFDFLLSSCFGIGPCFHEDVRESINKSISCSETFKLTNDVEFITRQFHSLCKKLFLNMVEQSVIGKTITIEITDKNEKHIAKSLSIIKRFETESELVNNGWTVLRSMLDGSTIRLLRVKISSLQQVNPEMLKKKDENQIKHWMGKLQLKEVPNVSSVVTRSKSAIKLKDENKNINKSNDKDSRSRSKGKSLNSSNGYHKLDGFFNKMKECPPQKKENIILSPKPKNNITSNQQLKRNSESDKSNKSKSKNKADKNNKKAKKTTNGNNNNQNSGKDKNKQKDKNKDKTSEGIKNGNLDSFFKK